MGPSVFDTNNYGQIDRQSRVQQQSLRPLRCPSCGSEWFFEIGLHQYQADAYSSSPGGDVSYFNDAGYVLRMCPCGHIVMPNLGGAQLGRQANNEVISLRTGLDAAAKFREKVKSLMADDAAGVDPKVLVQDVRDEVAGRVTTLEQTIDSLSAMVTELTGMVEELQTRPVKK